MALINKFAAKCSKCGALVAASAGVLTKTPKGWSTAHATCPAPAPYMAPYFPESSYSPSGYDDYDYSYENTGMTEGDWRDALNPDEGDK